MDSPPENPASGWSYMAAANIRPAPGGKLSGWKRNTLRKEESTLPKPVDPLAIPAPDESQSPGHSGPKPDPCHSEPGDSPVRNLLFAAIATTPYACPSPAPRTRGRCPAVTSDSHNCAIA